MSIKNQLIKASEEHINDEICGFICHDGEFKFIQAANRSDRPDQFFYISAVDFLKVKKEHNLIAIFHNHCRGTAEASEFDRAVGSNVCYPMAVYSNTDKKFGIYVPDTIECNVKLLEGLKEKLTGE